VMVQTWDAAHLEVMAVFFVVLGAGLLVRGRDAAAGVALGVAAAFKLTPLGLLVPALLGGRAKPARLLAGFFPAFLVPYAPYLATGGATGSLYQGGTEWAGPAVVFSLVARVTGPEAARIACALVFAAGAVWLARRLRGRALTAPAFAWTLSLLTLCLPVVHAWYWLAPLTLGLAAGLWLPAAAGLLAPLPEAFPLTWPSWLPPWRQSAALGLRRPLRNRTTVVRLARVADTDDGRTSTEGPM
jgi:Glycosyltransferase family 87